MNKRSLSFLELAVFAVIIFVCPGCSVWVQPVRVQDEPTSLLSNCQKAAEWNGIRQLSTLHRFEGISWDYTKEKKISMAAVPADLSGQDSFVVGVKLLKFVGGSIDFIVGSENSSTTERDYWTGSGMLDFKGDKNLIFNTRQMKAVGKPVGWDKITELSFTAKGQKQTGDKDDVIIIYKLWMANVPSGGPVMTDEEFFESLNLDYKGLEKVHRAVEAGDLKTAKHQLADYLRNRKTVKWFFDPHNIDRNIKYNKETADKAAKGRVEVAGRWHSFKDGKIDWYYNPTRYLKDVPYNKQWEHQLNRMIFWLSMGKAYRATGDEKYARAWVKQLRGWIKDCPLIGKGDVPQEPLSKQWYLLQAGIRMRIWPYAYHSFLRSPAFTDEDIVLYLKSTIEHSRYLRRHHRQDGNHMTTELKGLNLAAGVFPELKEAKEWRTYSINRTYQELANVFYPDGVSKELTPGYHNITAKGMWEIYKYAKLFGRLDEIPEGFTDGFEKAFDLNLFLMAPDGTVPTFNDSNTAKAGIFIKRAVKSFPHRKDYLWVTTDGKKGAPPKQTSYQFPYAGFYAMRSGWDKQANYLCFDSGPLGSAHVHQDKLSVVLWAYGRPILYDDGGGPYEQSKWRNYAIDTYSHNTVIVDGLAQRRTRRNKKHKFSSKPIDARWQSTPEYDFAAGTYDQGYGTKHVYGEKGKRVASHTRRVLFVKPELFIIADTLEPFDKATHTYQGRWHLKTTDTVTEAETGVVVTADKGLANLAVVPLLTDGLKVRTALGQTEPELLGWWVKKHSHGSEPTTTVLHTRSGKGIQQFLTLLLPIRPNEDNPVKSVRPTGAVSAEVVFADGRRLSIKASSDPKGVISVTEVSAGNKPGRSVTAGRD